MSKTPTVSFSQEYFGFDKDKADYFNMMKDLGEK